MIHYLKDGTIIPDPTVHEQYTIVKEHFEAMIEHYGERTGMLLSRKHLGWYSKGLRNSTDFRILINQEGEAENVREIIKRFFEEHLEIS